MHDRAAQVVVGVVIGLLFVALGAGAMKLLETRNEQQTRQQVKRELRAEVRAERKRMDEQRRSDLVAGCRRRQADARELRGFLNDAADAREAAGDLDVARSYRARATRIGTRLPPVVVCERAFPAR